MPSKSSNRKQRLPIPNPAYDAQSSRLNDNVSQNTLATTATRTNHRCRTASGSGDNMRNSTNASSNSNSISTNGHSSLRSSQPERLGSLRSDELHSDQADFGMDDHIEAEDTDRVEPKLQLGSLCLKPYIETEAGRFDNPG